MHPISVGGFLRSRVEWGLPLVVGLFSLLAPAPASTGTRALRAFIGPERRVHLITPAKREIVPAADSDQVEVESLLVSRDGTAAGWLALYPNEATSYPIPLKLLVWSHGRLHSFTGIGLPVWTWCFVGEGSLVAFEQETVHGGMGVHYELRDVVNDRKRGDWEPGRGHPPAWAAPLVSPDSR